MLHIFDVDNTVIKKTSTWYFLRQALRDGVIGLSQLRGLPLELFRYKLGFPNMDFIEEAVKRFAGIEKDVLEMTAQSCFERLIKPKIYTAAERLIREALARGEPLIFATSSLSVIIEPLERYFGIEGSIASVLELRENKTTGRIMGNSLFGIKKKEAVVSWLEKNSIDPKSVCFYSDSYTDLPLLEYCGRPAAVNPDRFLAKTAKQRGWEILRFEKTLGK